MGVLDHVYAASADLLRPALPVAERGLALAGSAGAKAAAALAGRRGGAAALVAWSRQARDPHRPLVWLHGASAGELAGAQPVVAALRSRIPRMQLLVTFSSPSGRSAAERMRPDGSGYVPFDAVRECRRAVAAARPSVLVFASGDVWPGLTRAAAREAVPVILINGRVRSRSRRMRRLPRAVLASSYGRLAGAAVVGEADAERLGRLGVASERIRVTGDAAFDRALQRADVAAEHFRAGAGRLPPLPSGTLRLLAGSTWREDEKALVTALRFLAKMRGCGEVRAAPAVELVLVPHEPERHAVGAIRELCVRELGVAPRLLSRLTAGASPAGRAPLVVDSVGFLADLYVEADIAFVGGSFGRQGVHSVLEPAAAGIPVLFGPRAESPEALELQSRGGGAVVETSRLGPFLWELAGDAGLRSRMGVAARGYVEEGRGAAEAAASLVIRFIPMGNRGRSSPP